MTAARFIKRRKKYNIFLALEYFLRKNIRSFQAFVLFQNQSHLLETSLWIK